MNKKENSIKCENEKRKGATIVELTKVSLVAAIFCMVAPHTLFLPVSPVGITPGILLVYLSGLLLGARLGVYSIFLYLLLGVCGLPVFSGYQGGPGVLFGPTGGYLLGYIPCVILAGTFSEKARIKKDGRMAFLTGMCLGTAAIYFTGTAWFLLGFAKGKSVFAGMLQCVLPFLPGDIVKMVVAMVLYKPVLRIRRMM